MIKSIADLSLRLADLVEAEGRLAKTHATRFLAAGLVLGLAAALAGGGALMIAAAALLALVAAGLAWPAALLVVAASLVASAAGLGVAGRGLLAGSRPASSPSSTPGTEDLAVRGHAA